MRVYNPIDVGAMASDLAYVEAVDPKTGQMNGAFKALKRYGQRSVGKILFGHTKEDGYKIIGWNKKYFLLHRLVVAFRLGHDLPLGYQVNHLDRNRSNNLSSNLELVSGDAEHTAVDRFGRRRGSVKKKCPNIFFNKRLSKWSVMFRHDGKLNYYGIFANHEDAVECRNRVALTLGAPLFEKNDSGEYEEIRLT